jgi:hypothetical protein
VKSLSVRSRRRPAVASAARAASGARTAVAEPLEARQLFTVALASAVSTPLSGVPTGDPAAPVLAEFDATPGLDVVVAFPANSAITSGFIQVGVGSGTGTFALAPAVDVGRFTSRPIVADFDGDGKADLAVTDAFGGNVLLLRGNGDGTFAAALSFAAGVSPESLAAGDFNGDGLADLAVGNRSDNTAQVFPGDATLGLGTPLTLATATDPASLAAADFTGDGFLDLLVGASGGTGATAGALQTFVGNGDGTFAAPVETASPRGVVATADVNADGTVDAIVGVTDADTAVVAFNNGDGTFTVDAGAVDPTKAAVVADLDQDSRTDLVTAVAGTIDVLPGRGDGSFAPAVSADAAGGSGPAVGDVTGDGRPDVLTVTATPGVQLGRTLNVSAGRLVGPDLKVELLTGLPAAALNGSNQRATVRVTNHGNEAIKADTLLQLTASFDAVPDADDSLLTQTAVKLNLKPGKAKTYKLKFPLTVGTGTYTVFARVDPNGLNGDLNLDDNSAASPQTFTVANPFIELATVNPGPGVTTLAIGNKGRVVLTIQNLGNVVAGGKIGLALTLSADQTSGDSDPLLVATTKSLKIPANGSKAVALKFKVPTGVAPGSYYVLGLANFNQAIEEADLSNNVAASPVPVTITG